MSLSVTLTNFTLKVKVVAELAYYAFKLMTLALDLIRTEQSAITANKVLQDWIFTQSHHQNLQSRGHLQCQDL